MQNSAKTSSQNETAGRYGNSKLEGRWSGFDELRSKKGSKQTAGKNDVDLNWVPQIAFSRPLNGKLIRVRRKEFIKWGFGVGVVLQQYS